jgi:hypothetical protein
LKKNLNKEQLQTCQNKKPQEEVLESKPSTASSDEEKLAASQETLWSTEEKARPEKKMEEGTWMAEKPKRKTPPSQDKGTAGNSGDVKRPHSHSSTPSQEKQKPKKSRNTQVQTGTYKEAAVGIKTAIVHRHHPDVSLDQAQTDIIQAKILTAVDANPLEEAPPQFLYSKFAQGVCK